MPDVVIPPVAEGPRNGDLPAYVSNGLIGLRVREVPLIAGMVLVSGLAGEDPERQIEAAAAAPYPLAGDLALNGVWMSDQPWAISDLRQSYDFASGELSSQFRFTAAQRTLSVEVLTFASRTAPAAVAQEVRLTADAACDLTFRALVDVDGVHGRMLRRRTDTPGEPEPACDGSLLWETEGGLGRCGVALLTEGPDGARRQVMAHPQGPLCTEHQLRLSAGRPVRFRQLAALIPSVQHERPDEEAVRRVARAGRTGFDDLRRCNREAWSDLWRGRIVVDGAAPDHQALIDAAFYYLNASAHPASPSSTSIFGLATWHDYHYYYGHVMWDVDAFCLPPLLLMQPDAAQALLAFRTRGRAAAGTNARLSSRRGLQFPWQAAPTTGQEAAPGAGDAAQHEDHVSLHVARAFSLYADATGDERFLREDAWPVLSGVADWFVSRVQRTSRGFELPCAMGPAEVPQPPDNDAFTLMAGADILRRAGRAAERLGEPAPAAWGEVAANLYLPVRSDGVIAAHDDFTVREPKGATPSPLAGLFPYDYPASAAQRRRTLDFYLKLWPDYVGAPMLPALYCVWATMAGDRKLALKLFEEGYAAYDQPRFHQCLEYRLDQAEGTAAGPFFANLGGLLMGLTYGLTGLQIDDGPPEAWARRPVVLPEGWREIRIERLWVRGRPARLTARHGAERAELTFL
ncbi:glycoside hydrolase family 65 protein [Brevundimonas diminuta]|uniref:glycoside hydrolase family 65 protein n=1 Tax=Brevundimonas diminuta TaxID=293 RepID=UPI0020976097|nr:glycoside hydrolase family 65 protein [Brevundimonas diminuta]MCO8018615.1 glycoside hydrolase family 65 protein [Brevundimonas diminuta]MCO8020534.1 glycoside hydrolase family 65 protein [Brevundimonas diminuta]